jgi:hypothetical protein
MCNVRRGHTLGVRIALVIALGLALAGPAAATTGTLRGTISRGPIQPVCRVGTACGAPARRVTIVFRRGATTHRVTSDANGRYRAVLAAGTWSVALPSRRDGMSIAPTHVVVRAATTRTVALTIDTGIR